MKSVVIIAALFLIVGCGQGPETSNQLQNKVPPVNAAPTPPPEATKTTGTECKICNYDFATYKGELKKEEVDGLLLALNDEYMALAIYEQVNKDFRNPRPFINIREAEARHAERLKVLFKTHGIPVPENGWIGSAPKFENVAAACKAGVDAEIANRDLYTRLLKSTAREDILMVYRELQRASEQNHLPAFERCGAGGGGPGGGGRRGGRPF